MILILKPDTNTGTEQYQQLIAHLDSAPQITYSMHQIDGAGQRLTEIYLIGDTASLSAADMNSLPCVERVVRVQDS